MLKYALNSNLQKYFTEATRRRVSEQLRKPTVISEMADRKECKVLVALDFDHTVIDNNSDTYVCKLAPGGCIPDHLKALYRKDGWTQYMGEIFKLLHSNQVTREDILTCLTEISLTPGMRDLLTGLPRKDTEFIIISDANYVFIDHILKHLGLRDLFKEVYTNPAEFDEGGCLRVKMYHLQDWCSLSTKNLCKGDILTNYIKSREEQNIVFKTVAYIGDGTNDFCPGLRLRGGDMVFPRRGYSLTDYIAKMEMKGVQLEAEICVWDSGKEILEQLLKCYQNLNESRIPVPRLREPSAFTNL
ncbi:hypothetical protein Pcinc_029086 [Petrolisthes cinctipes]|uniref:Pyridoxal phosphate phosphatase PHOSPHO2 n=1 Tax=Petrolisthes cinctipes TaxID=88211 RepID=A0AAE1F1R9_PETCI|nr:hypothetical protein Pcinc_029086 [Petrolisthes cinctipes]